MPGIGDLLAEISGGKSAPASKDTSRPSPAASASRAASTTKRKADDDLRGAGEAKAPRPVPPLAGSRPSVPLETQRAPRPADKTVSSPLPSARSSKVSERPSPSVKHSTSATRPTSMSSRPPLAGGSSSKPATPATSKGQPTPPTASSASKVEPKKGSFAEIMARAQAAQAKMGQVGKIQHKPVEKGPSKKERLEMRAEMLSSLKKARLPVGGSKARDISSPARNGASSKGVSRDARGKDKIVVGMDRHAREKASAEAEREKKPKKAATATTGYTGTSRARPGGQSNKKNNAPRGGALLDTRALHRHTHDDEYDEDMDDFIVDDDDEEDGYGGGRRYDSYDSDGSSDMEAGLDDIDEEERFATVAARREDLREEREEAARKKAKEERKRQLLEAQRRRY